MPLFHGFVEKNERNKKKTDTLIIMHRWCPHLYFFGFFSQAQAEAENFIGSRPSVRVAGERPNLGESKTRYLVENSNGGQFRVEIDLNLLILHWATTISSFHLFIFTMGKFFEDAFLKSALFGEISSFTQTSFTRLFQRRLFFFFLQLDFSQVFPIQD